MDEELSGDELIQKWQDREKAWHFESNTKNLTKLVNVIGYRDQGYGSAVEEFLNDNPGAQLAIVEWIAEWVDRNKDWKQALIDETTCTECLGIVPPGYTCPECGEEGESL